MFRMPPRYDRIGHGYARTRREDPRFRARIHDALGAARTVVNVGAGAGSYEPADRYVIAIEPSDVMAAQRPPGLAPAMAILSLHHWDDDRECGVREMRRVSRGPVVLLTFDPVVSNAMWLMKDYLPEVAALDDAIFPSPEAIGGWLGGHVTVTPVAIFRDTPDWMLGSFWAHPERVLDADARAATSGFARMRPDVVERVVAAVARDLSDGTWDRAHGALRSLDEYDAGLRLVVGHAAPA
jgi:hypothetical protein